MILNFMNRACKHSAQALQLYAMHLLRFLLVNSPLNLAPDQQPQDSHARYKETEAADTTIRGPSIPVFNLIESLAVDATDQRGQRLKDRAVFAADSAI
ncbi:MAG: hypothetical protein NTZ90_17890, partial [Proteobacteria bacterium]|nr:hypothetical protein [Pseudomonadota bacterium]